MDQLFQYCNFTVAGLQAVGALSHLFNFSIASIFATMFGLCFAALIAIAELRKPYYIARYASFMQSFAGRGVFYIYLGTLLLYGATIRWLVGLVLMIVGSGYFAAELSNVSPPDSMRFDPEMPNDTV